MTNLTTIWCPGDFDQVARDFKLHADDALALFKPEQQPAPVVDLFTGEVVR